MKNLQDARREYQELQGDYNEKKKRYDKTALGYSSDLQDLEKQCNFLSEEMIAAERRFHYLTAVLGNLRIDMERVELEERCKAGKERFLPDFPTIEDLYLNKLSQQENLAKQLRNQQRDLKENEQEFIRQKLLFSDLHKLLACKLRSAEMKGSHGNSQVENEVVDIGNAQVLCC